MLKSEIYDGKRRVESIAQYKQPLPALSFLNKKGGCLCEGNNFCNCGTTCEMINQGN